MLDWREWIRCSWIISLLSSGGSNLPLDWNATERQTNMNTMKLWGRNRNILNNYSKPFHRDKSFLTRQYLNGTLCCVIITTLNRHMVITGGIEECWLEHDLMDDQCNDIKYHNLIGESENLLSLSKERTVTIRIEILWVLCYLTNRIRIRNEFEMESDVRRNVV